MTAPETNTFASVALSACLFLALIFGYFAGRHAARKNENQEILNPLLTEDEVSDEGKKWARMRNTMIGAMCAGGLLYAIFMAITSG
jgi:hypothetical protein